MPGLFHKPFRVKSHTKMKATERKQFVEAVKRQFEKLENELELFGSAKCELFKEKVVTHTGQVAFLYFCGQQPLLYEVEGQLYPTVYALWRSPALLLRLTMSHSVLGALQNGADLMVPGLVPPAGAEPGPRMFGRFAKGAACCLASDRLGSALAVGRANHAADDLFACGGHGKAVIVDHVVGDELWLRGDQSEPPAASVGADDAAAADDNVAGATDDADAGAGDDAGEGGEAAACGGASAQAQDDQAAAEDSDEAGEERQEDVDAHFLNCFLHALRYRVKDKDLPLLCSSLVANCMSPYSRTPLNVKRTSFKKFNAFLEAMRLEGLVQVDNNKGVVSIVSVDRGHQLLQQPEPRLEWQERREDSQQAFVPVGIEEVHFVTAPTAELFKRSGHLKGSCLTGKQVRELVTDYVKQQGLQSADNPKEVQLDQLLSGAAANSKEYRLADSLTWDRLFQVFYSAMTSGYRVLAADGRVLLERKGKVPKICLRVESRANRKEISIVTCLADFGVDLVEFSKTVQKALSVNAAPQPNGDVNVQGNQLVYLSKLLTGKYNISKKHINGYTVSKK